MVSTLFSCFGLLDKGVRPFYFKILSILFSTLIISLEKEIVQSLVFSIPYPFFTFLFNFEIFLIFQLKNSY